MKIQLLILLLPILTLQWWDVGHMLTAKIAEIRLKEYNAFAYINFKQLVESIRDLVDDQGKNFVESACWPDDLKQRKYNMELWNSWHFINKPLVPDGVFPIINFTGTVINSCMVIKNATQVLSVNLNKTTAERALFARYLIHVIGDIHQPLHSVALYNETYPSGDRGGNSLNITLLDSGKSNLHSFWDSGAFKIQNDSWYLVRPLDLSNQTAITNVAFDYIKQYGQSVEELAKELDPFVWATESLELSKNTTYPKMSETNVVDSQYSDLTFQTAKKRIVLAGYRIANTVLSIYEQSTFRFPQRYEEYILAKAQGQEIRTYGEE